MDLQCVLVSPLVPVCEHLAKDISHSAIYRSSETFPFQLKGFVIQRLRHMCVCVCVCVCVQMHGSERTRDLKRELQTAVK